MSYTMDTVKSKVDRYTIRTTGTVSGKGFMHQILRDGKLTTYAEYGPGKDPPKRMQRWLKKLNAGEQG